MMMALGSAMQSFQALAASSCVAMLVLSSFLVCVTGLKQSLQILQRWLHLCVN